MVQTANTIYRDFVTDGVPATGIWNPRKVEIREWGTWLEGMIGAVLSAGGKIYASKVQMTADLSPIANTPAIVMGDGANDGYYQKVGGTGAGSWQYRGPLPYSFIRAINAGAGTANALIATSSVLVPAADGAALVTVNVAVENTGPATVAFNGGPTLHILTSSAQPLAAGYLKPGMLISGFREGANFRLTTDVASAAIQATAEAAAHAALAAAAGVNLPPIQPSDAQKVLTVKTDLSGYELKAPEIIDIMTLPQVTL